MAIAREDKDRIHLALEKASGNRKIAGIYLGMTADELKSKIHSCPELKARWATSQNEPTQKVPDEVTATNREVIEIKTPTREEVEIAAAQAMAMEAKAMGDDMARLKIPQGALEIAVEMALFNRKHFIRSLDMINGGATRQAALINYHMDSGWKRLEEVRAMIAQTASTDEFGQLKLKAELRELLVEEEKSLMLSQATFAKALTESQKMALKVAETLALMRARINGESPAMKTLKPGFSNEDTSSTERMDSGDDRQASG